MTEQKSKEPTLSFNRATGYYEGTITVQVNAEIFRRLLLRAVEEDESADLTDPETWVRVIARVGKIMNWLDKPNVKFTPVTPASPEPIDKPVEQKKTQTELLREELREKVRNMPPHQWLDFRLTPIPSKDLDRKEQQRFSNRRHDEKVILERLLEEWEDGQFQISQEAEEQERIYRQSCQDAVIETVEHVAEAVNGNRFH